jgi:hypothetical protein
MRSLAVSLSQWSFWDAGPSPAVLTSARTPEGISDPRLARAFKASWRRRLNLFSRAAAEVISGAIDASEQPSIIFASRHGDMHRTMALMDQITEHEPLSPTDFSMAVHNATAGITSINYGITQAHTAVSAGANTLLAALSEAAGQLVSAPQTPVVVVFVDLPLPPVFSAFDTPGAQGAALAFRLSVPPAHASSREGAQQQARARLKSQGLEKWSSQNGTALTLSPLSGDGPPTHALDHCHRLAAFVQQPQQALCDMIGRGMSWRLARDA